MTNERIKEIEVLADYYKDGTEAEERLIAAIEELVTEVRRQGDEIEYLKSELLVPRYLSN